jgi:hypothetical protein
LLRYLPHVCFAALWLASAGLVVLILYGILKHAGYAP